MFFNNGDRYEGDWKNNVYEGKGIYFWKDGRKYEGNWKNDKKEGVGIFYLLMVIDMMVIGKMINKKEKESFILIMVTNIKVFGVTM